MTDEQKWGGVYFPLILFAGLVIGGAWIVDMLPGAAPSLPARTGLAIRDAGSWGYQLQDVRASRIPDYMDVLVIDYSKDGSQERAYTRAEIEKLRRRRDGTRRIVLAYMSVGEAERYRFYWWPHWRLMRPSWLGEENAEWKGNFPVRYWQHGWQSNLVKLRHSLLDRWLESVMPWRKAYLDRLLEAGFDGVFLDRVDVFNAWEKERKDAAETMVSFIAELSAYAKSRKPGFLIMPQNGEELLRFAGYRKAIDAIAKEDLFYGNSEDGKANSPNDVKAVLEDLDLAGQFDIPVFLVEYLSDPIQRQRAQKRAEEHYFILHFATRALDKPPVALPPRGKRASVRPGILTGQGALPPPGALTRPGVSLPPAATNRR